MDFLKVQELVDLHGTPSLFLSESRLRESYRTLKAALPGVNLFYALKSIASREIVSILDNEESCFDICTNGEIDILKSCNISANRTIHTHPIKRDSDIRYALDYGVKIFVADNEAELRKFLPGARLSGGF